MLHLVVAVTVLSLAVSPFWVVTARRLHEMTTTVVTFGELMTSVYGYEANIVVTTVTKVRPQFALALRSLKHGIKTFRIKERLKSTTKMAVWVTRYLPFYQKGQAPNDNPSARTAQENEDSKSA